MAEKQDNKTNNESTLKRLEDFWTSAMGDASQREWRNDIAIPCFEYKENKQWTQSELDELKKRHQPPTVNNQVKVTIDRIVGQYVKQKTRIAFRGRNTPDETYGNALTDLFRFIAQNNDLEFEEKDMFEDGVTSGFGVLDVRVEFDETFEPEIIIEHEDSLQSFYDPKSRRYDWNKDATFVGRWKWVDLEEAKELFPDHADELAQAMNIESQASEAGKVDQLQNATFFIDKERQRIRLIEIQYKVKKREKIFVIRGMGVVPEEALEAAQLKQLRAAGMVLREDFRMKETINHGVFTSGILLEHKETPRRFFSLVPFFVQRKKNGAPYSSVYTALPLQDAINKRESKALHLLSVNQAIFETGAVENKDEMAANKERADGLIELQDGGMEKFELVKNVDLAATQMNFHQDSLVNFRRVTGVNPDALGEKSEIRSGVGISKKIAQTELIIAPIFDSLRRTRAILARNVLDLIQIYYNDQKVFAITDDLQAAKAVTIGADKFDAIKKFKFDVVIDEITDLATSRSEQFAQLSDILPRVIPLGSFWARVLIQASDVYNKEDLLKQLENIPPPPNEPKINITAQIEQLTPPERAFFYQKMGSPELAQMVMQSAPPPKSVLDAQEAAADNQAQAQSDMMKAQGDQMKLQTIAAKSQADQVKAQIDIQKSEIDLQKEVLKLQQATQPESNIQEG